MKMSEALKKLREMKLVGTAVQPPQRLLHPPSPAAIKAMKALTELKAAKEPVDDKPPFECEVCHKAIANRNDVVCFSEQPNKAVRFGVPNIGWTRLVCSTKCAHALLDVQIVTWRLRGLFNVPEEEDEY